MITKLPNSLMNKLFTNLWFWVVLLHLVIIAAWYYLGQVTPEPTYTPPPASPPKEKILKP